MRKVDMLQGDHRPEGPRRRRRLDTCVLPPLHGVRSSSVLRRGFDRVMSGGTWVGEMAFICFDEQVTRRVLSSVCSGEFVYYILCGRKHQMFIRMSTLLAFMTMLEVASAGSTIVSI